MLAVAAGGCAGGNPAPAGQAESMPKAAPVAAAFPEADTAAALHLLNRLTFGPRPGDIGAVQRIGIQRWLDQQLDPARLDDPAQAQVRQRYPAAFLSPPEFYREYPPPQLARRQAGDSMPRRNDQRRPQDPDMRPGMDTMAVVRFAQGQRAAGGQLVLATVARHTLSERQLQEVMTDFWFNHFNVFIGKQLTRYVLSDYLERAIRPNVLGRFEDLLSAVAHHPAMLVYLDNAQSVAPGSQPPQAARRVMAQLPDEVRRQMPAGLNENYARELLELHTLGVDGGYTQADVQNVARILTGWSMVGPGPLAMEARQDVMAGESGRGRGLGRRRPPQRDPFTFEFRDWAHDRGAKLVLGVEFPAGRMQDEGERLLTMLAQHPSTARHLAHKLCARFVADDPPDGCVDHAVVAYRRSNGSIAETVRAIVTSEDFWAPANRRNKVKSPLEFLVGALRVTGMQPDSSPRLAGALQQLGQPLFQQAVPTGYPETQEDWVNSGALLNRMNMAVAIAAGRLPGLAAAPGAPMAATDDKGALLVAVNRAILGGQGSDNTLRVIRQQIADLADPRAARTMAVGLALGSPEFQRQ